MESLYFLGIMTHEHIMNITLTCNSYLQHQQTTHTRTQQVVMQLYEFPASGSKGCLDYAEDDR